MLFVLLAATLDVEAAATHDVKAECAADTAKAEEELEPEPELPEQPIQLHVG